jgi:regulator of sirC expression with transglutaminase-like and TPR domain
MVPQTRDEAEHVLASLGAASTERFDLTVAALASSVHEAPGLTLSRALDVLEEVTATVRREAPGASAADLSAILHHKLGFGGARSDYDAPENADLRSVLERRRGLPVALGAVWRHAARSVGLPLHGTDMPGHFLMRLETDTGPQLLDVYNGGRVLGEAELVGLARQAGAPGLLPQMIQPVPDRTIALRLQTNLAIRARMNGETGAWERATWRRTLLLPDQPVLLLEHAEAAAACGLIGRARDSASRAALLASDSTDDQIASLSRKALNLVATLGRRLN